jgi:hypothetical protein
LGRGRSRERGRINGMVFDRGRGWGGWGILEQENYLLEGVETREGGVKKHDRVRK